MFVQLGWLALLCVVAIVLTKATHKEGVHHATIDVHHDANIDVHHDATTDVHHKQSNLKASERLVEKYSPKKLYFFGCLFIELAVGYLRTTGYYYIGRFNIMI